MKTGLVILFILDIIKTTKTEFRHHQQQQQQQQDRYARENFTVLPWSSTSLYKSIQGLETVGTGYNGEGDTEWTGAKDPSENFTKSKSLSAENAENFLGASFQSNQTKSFRMDDEDNYHGRKTIENQTETIFSTWKSRAKEKKRTNRISEMENLMKDEEMENSSLLVSESRRVNSQKLSIIDSLGKIHSQSINSNHSEDVTKRGDGGGGGGVGDVGGNNMNNSSSSGVSFSQESTTQLELSSLAALNWVKNFSGQKFRSEEKFSDDGDKFQNLNREIFNLEFAEPQVALTDTYKPETCVEHVIESYEVTNEVVTTDVLTDRLEAEKLANALMNNNGDLDKITDTMEYLMEKHPRIASASVTALKRTQRSQVSQMVYRSGNDLLIDRRSEENGKSNSASENTWTRIFKNCLMNSWVFGYYFFVESDSLRVETTVYFSTDHINGTVDQCNPSFARVLNGGPKCDAETSKCLAKGNSGFALGGYKCVCREGFHSSRSFLDEDGYADGVDLEKTFQVGNTSRFRCLSCRDSCSGVCNDSGMCVFQRNNLLKNCILSIQVVCVFATTALIVIVFKHRKCKTIATGMWTIMEMILLGSIILYGTIIIRAFNPSTTFCLIESWCREIGFVLCYGAIILKLYRILIEFRTRKAHRWVIRDKDLLKYLLGMVIVVFGYMSAWTATNLDLIQKENYSMVTTGKTAEGIEFKACKAAWWNYVTETSEILILIFGIHLSYASRNATSQFRERCFLCISISTEALISGVFYVLRYFYWETAVHPDTSFLANFIRCQLTTTVILVLLFAPKWWYQKIQVNKGRVSRNYLMQESGRGPLEAFKPQDGVTATNSDVEGEISLADMNPEDIRLELKRLYTQLEVLKNKTIRFDNPHISKRRGGRKIAHRRFSLQTLRQQTHRLSSRHTEIEVTEAEASRTPEDSVCSVEGPSIVINDGPSESSPRKSQK